MHVPSKSCMQDSCTILHDLASSFLLGGGLTSHNLVFSLSCPISVFCYGDRVAWFTFGCEIPLVPKIQAGQKCQFCDQYYLSMVLVMPRKFRLGRS